MMILKAACAALAFTSLAAHAHELSPDECGTASEFAWSVTQQRDEGVALDQLKSDMSDFGNGLGDGVLGAIAQWSYAEPDKTPVEMATRFWNACVRNRGRIDELLTVDKRAPLQASECYLIAELTPLVQQQQAQGLPLDQVLVQIWSGEYDQHAIHAVNAFAELTKKIYRQPSDDVAEQFLPACLKQAGTEV